MDRRKQALFDLAQTKGIIMFQFADRNMKLFKERGFTDRKNGSGGIKKPTGKTV